MFNVWLVDALTRHRLLACPLYRLYVVGPSVVQASVRRGEPAQRTPLLTRAERRLTLTSPAE